MEDNKVESSVNTEATAVVQIKPEADEAFLQLQEQIFGIRKWAEKREIKTTDDLAPVTDDLSVIARLRKSLEELRKLYVQPINDYAKAINETFKLLSEPLEEANRINRKKILDWEAAVKRLADAQKATAEAEAALKGNDGLESSEQPIIQELPPDKTHTEMGTVGKRMVRKWEIEDKTKVPYEYLVVDAPQITKLVKAGINHIEGIRIYEEPVITVNATKS